MNSPTAFQKLYDFYLKLYVDVKALEKRDRFPWGERCLEYALDALEWAAAAQFTPRQRKADLLIKLSARIDMLKILLRLGHDLKIIDAKKYAARSAELVEAGNLTGKWLQSIS